MNWLIVFCAKYLFLAVPLLFVFAWRQANQSHKKSLVLAVTAAIILAVLLDKVGGKLFYDPRPFTHGIKPLVNHVADNGFPSEHTLFSVTISTVIFLFRKRLGLLSLGISLAVGIARVAAHVHSPIDIIGAIVMGAAAGWAGYYFAKNVLAKTRA